MGSENLSHRFAAEDPTFKKDTSTNHDAENSSSHHCFFRTCGTHPVSISNGLKSSSSSSSKTKGKLSSKYKKLYKLYHRQLSHIETSLNAIESSSKSDDTNQDKIHLSNKKRVDQLNEDLENLRNSLCTNNHEHYDQMKHDIEQLMKDLKSDKMEHNSRDSKNSNDHLVGLPLNVSDSEEDEKDGDETTVMYF